MQKQKFRAIFLKRLAKNFCFYNTKTNYLLLLLLLSILSLFCSFLLLFLLFFLFSFLFFSDIIKSTPNLKFNYIFYKLSKKYSSSWKIFYYRIAVTLFIYFLNFYGILYKKEKQVIDNNTLTALTLLIAESNPKEKDVIIDLIMNFLNNE